MDALLEYRQRSGPRPRRGGSAAEALAYAFAAARGGLRGRNRPAGLSRARGGARLAGFCFPRSVFWPWWRFTKGCIADWGHQRAPASITSAPSRGSRTAGRARDRGESAICRSDHPYAEHLDLFGEGSLFQLLCSAKTQPGQDTLAGWLMGPASPAELRERRGAVEELRESVTHREEIDRLCERVGRGVDPGRLQAWAEHRVPAPGLGVRAGMVGMTLCTVGSLVAWLGFRGPPLLFLFFLGAAWFAEQRLRTRLESLMETLDRVAGQLDSLARILQWMERAHLRVDPACGTPRHSARGRISTPIGPPSKAAPSPGMARLSAQSPLFAGGVSPVVAHSLSAWPSRPGWPQMLRI